MAPDIYFLFFISSSCFCCILTFWEWAYWALKYTKKMLSPFKKLTLVSEGPQWGPCSFINQGLGGLPWCFSIYLPPFAEGPWVQVCRPQVLKKKQWWSLLFHILEISSQVNSGSHCTEVHRLSRDRHAQVKCCDQEGIGDEALKESSVPSACWATPGTGRNGPRSKRECHRGCCLWGSSWLHDFILIRNLLSFKHSELIFDYLAIL